jgi:hypothetical protein
MTIQQPVPPVRVGDAREIRPRAEVGNDDDVPDLRESLSSLTDPREYVDGLARVAVPVRAD